MRLLASIIFASIWGEAAGARYSSSLSTFARFIWLAVTVSLISSSTLTVEDFFNRRDNRPLLPAFCNNPSIAVSFFLRGRFVPTGVHHVLQSASRKESPIRLVIFTMSLIFFYFTIKPDICQVAYAASWTLFAVTQRHPGLGGHPVQPLPERAELSRLVKLLAKAGILLDVHGQQLGIIVQAVLKIAKSVTQL